MFFHITKVKNNTQKTQDMTTYERALKRIASIVKSINNKPLPKDVYEKALGIRK